MKYKTINTSDIKELIHGFIHSDRFAKEIAPICAANIEVFKGSSIEELIRWFIEYVQKYNVAPKRETKSYVKARCKKLPGEKVAVIKKVVISCLKKRESSQNQDYAIDKAINWIQRSSIKLLKDKLVVALESEQIEAAVQEISNYRLVQRTTTSAIDPIGDLSVVFDAFEEETEPLFEYPGALGRFWNDQLIREGFIGIMGPEKRGKSWRLMEMALRAYRWGNNVAFFEVGDMSRRQWIRRFHVMLSGKNYRKKYCGDILIPQLDCMNNQMGDCSKCCNSFVRDKESGLIVPFSKAPGNYQSCCKCRGKVDFEGAVWYKKIHIAKPLTWGEAYKRGQKLLHKSLGKRFKFSVHPNSSVSVMDIESILDAWEAFDDFIPDVIVIDYADILAPMDKRKDERGQKNETWKALRRVSQERRCLLVTATQADADSYNRKVLGLSNFSEDKRIYGHVTSMFSLNQTPEEKRQGIMRIGNLVVREDDFNTVDTVSVLQCLPIGKPFLDSF